ncbi:MAG: ATP synthase subunit I [Acidimicrobiia bacterium]|nr:ATP synthase subunit I [Acidimicrobiia bacterium]
MTALTTRFDPSSAPEQQVANHIATRAAYLAPVLLVIAGIGWGLDGVASTSVAVGLVVVNFLLAAAILTYAGRISIALLMAATMFGYILRLGVLAGAVLALRNQPWMEMLPFGLTLIVTHLGLLLWETKYVSASLAYPGLKPTATSPGSIKE